MIDEWFKSPFVKSFKDINLKIARDSIFGVLTNPKNSISPYGNAQVIWYEINENTNPIDIFRRLNIGQIPLTNSELIKALFLQKSKYATEDIDGQQLQIAAEWDRIEYAFQRSDFWFFINVKENNSPSRIDFLFDTICQIETENHPELIEKIGDDKDKTFRFFYNKIVSKRQFVKDRIEDVKVIMNLWDDVTDYFRAIEEWFSDPVYYHYVGFLIYCGKTVCDIYKLYKGPDFKGITNDCFLKKLKEEMKKQVRITCYKDKNENFVITNPSYSKDTKEIRKVLLLLNIEYIVKQREKNYIRFPFDRFKDKKNGHG